MRQRQSRRKKRRKKHRKKRQSRHQLPLEIILPEAVPIITALPNLLIPEVIITPGAVPVIPSGGLTPSKGRIWFNGHTETYYSQKVLPGAGLNIPGRHIASDGTIRDKDGYIVLASDDYPKGTVVETSLGAGKVYDSGSGKGNIDLYTDW